MFVACVAVLQRAALTGALVILGASAVAAQDLLTEMTMGGVEFSPTVQVPLQPPTLMGEFSEKELTDRKKRLAGNDDWDRFVRDSVVAPVTIKLEYVTDSQGTRVGHNVHSAFVVHAKLASIVDRDLMEQIFGKAQSSSNESGLKFEELSAQELAEAGIVAAGNGDGSETAESVKKTFSQIEFDLLEKIRLRGVMCIERSSTPNSITVAWRMEPEFGESKVRATTWQRIGANTTEPKPYRGWGGYLHVTRISESPEMLMIESRMLLHELPEWFSASNFVRSKLPLAIQESARSFRRKLKAE